MSSVQVLRRDHLNLHVLRAQPVCWPDPCPSFCQSGASFFGRAFFFWAVSFFRFAQTARLPGPELGEARPWRGASIMGLAIQRCITNITQIQTGNVGGVQRFRAKAPTCTVVNGAVSPRTTTWALAITIAVIAFCPVLTIYYSTISVFRCVPKLL